MSDVLVIRCNMLVDQKTLKKFRDIILAEKESGVILLPAMFECIVVPDDVQIRFEVKED